ncbi:MAG: DEAD/DEAH box helicase [Cellulomonadaceae bacterium]|jgi:ATP-dependent RNA helicase DeaD|nr:DEAD/DEAH box helicase [Cellulomonadaceae bacterium]
MLENSGPNSRHEGAESGSNPSFAQIDLPAELAAAVADLGFSTPTPIQAQAIPVLLNGRDLVGVAQTGTGKTLAFGLPLLASLDISFGGAEHDEVPEGSRRRGNKSGKPVQALILTPTRELAIQVADAIQSFATKLPVKILPVYGGAPYMPQQYALAEGVDVVVGTPGRVMDHMDRGNLNLGQVKFVVLDEADEMLRMGFAEDVEKIFTGIAGPKQTALFSATMPPAIRAVADSHMVNPMRISVTPQASTVDSVSQSYAIVPFKHKVGALVRVLQTSDAEATIVFCRTRSAAEEVGVDLVARGISAATISGDVAQKEREKIVERLRDGSLDVLVATDVAARGLDVERVGLVVNFDIPREPESYVHRIGRTGRAGRAGRAISFVSPGERSKLKHIEQTIKATIAEMAIPSPKDVSEYKAREVLMQVATRRKAGRLERYAELVREQLLTHSDYNIVDPEKAVELAAILLALAVGDDGPKFRAELEAYESEVAEKKRTSNEAKDAKRKATERLGERKEKPRSKYGAGGGNTYRVSVGHRDGVTPAAIVGALTGESNLRGGDIGKIDIYPSFSLVSINAPLFRDELSKLSRATVAGRQLKITEDKGPRRESGFGKRDKDFGPKQRDKDFGPHRDKERKRPKW